MKIIASVIVFTVLALTGCAGITGADVATRVMAGLSCVSALTAIAQPLAVDPSLGFATALDVFNSINKITDATKAATVAAPCAETLSYLVQDAQGAKAMIDAGLASPTAPARLGRMAPGRYGDRPTLIQVPLH